MKYTKEQIRAANEVDIAAFLMSRGEKLKRAGSELRWGADHSVTMRGNLWHDHATDEGGLALDFVMKYMNLGFKEAVGLLLTGEQGNGFAKTIKSIVTRRKFELPHRDSNMHKVFAYLTQTRGISSDVVSHFAHQHTIYQSAPHGNVVFVGCDEAGAAKYAHSKSTNSDGKFRCDVAGSNKEYPFCHVGSSMFLFVFESPIDMLSYITMNQDNWQ